jgi:hypothetical protein
MSSNSKGKSVARNRSSRGECSNVRAGKPCSEHDHESSRTIEVEIVDEHELDVDQIG